ncbi:hypothetical protein [Cupriavidus necator]|uniref:hypothetical protein n=1 Tax=Cupriavidus necator TaxID=106590 RepID=UPI0019D16E64
MQRRGNAPGRTSSPHALSSAGKKPALLGPENHRAFLSRASHISFAVGTSLPLRSVASNVAAFTAFIQCGHENVTGVEMPETASCRPKISESSIARVFASGPLSLTRSRALLSRPLPQADPVTVSMCEQMCGRLMESRRVRAGAAATIRQYLNVVPGAMSSTLEDMARLMNTSQRTLKRRLQDEGTNYRTLLAEARGGFAKQLLLDHGL